MANLKVKDGLGAEKHLKTSGAGTDGDPHIPEHTISGTVAVSASALPLPSGAATAANQTTEIGHLATIAGAVGGGLTDTQLRASAVPVSGSVTVSGTVGVTGVATAANQSTEITHLTTLAGAVAGGHVQVDVLTAPTTPITAASLPLPSGAATSANQSTGNGYLQTLAGAVAGTEVQVDVLTLPNVTVGAALPAGTNNIGDVDVLTLPALAAGTNYIGTIGARDGMIEITPTLDTNAYTAGDTLFAATEIANAAGASGIPVILNTVLVVDKDDQGAAMDLHFFDRSVTFGTANAAPGISDADAAYYLGHVSVAAGDYKDLGGVKVATVKGIALGPIKPNATSIYVGGVTGGTPTHSASGLVIKFGFMRA